MNNRNKSGKKDVKTIAVMMGATLIAKLLGMLRSVLQARLYGTSDAANAFTAASKLPLTFFDMLLAAAILGCFIPVYNSFSKDGELDSSAADRFAGRFITLITLCCGLLALVGILLADPLISLIAPGLSPESHTLAVTLTRIMFPLVLFAGSAYTLVGVLQSKGSFIAPAMISAISNAGVVVYLLFLDRAFGEKGIYGLAAAYMLSWLVQLLSLILPLAKVGFSFKPSLDLHDPALVKAMKMAPPIMLGSWLAPASTLLGQYFASSASQYSGISGAATVFDIANNIYVILAGTLTYSICNYTFPKISRLSADGNAREFAESVRRGLSSALFIIIPFMAAALVLAPEGVSILYLRGEFTAADARDTTMTLLPILAAMPFFAVTELFSRVFYSKNRVKLPMIAAVCGIAANFAIGASLIFTKTAGLTAVGIANASGQLVSAVVLIIFALREIPGLMSGFGTELARLVSGGVIVYALCMLMRFALGFTPLGAVAYESGMLANTLRAVVIFVPSAAAYLLFARITARTKRQKN